MSGASSVSTTTPTAGHHRPWYGAIRMFAAELLLVPTGLITAGVLTRQLGSAEYGRYVLAVATVGWVQWTATALLSRATNRVVAAATDWRPLAAEIIRLHGFLGIMAALVVLVAAPGLAALLHQPDVTPVLRLLAIDVLVTVVTAGYRSVLIAMGEHGWLSAISAARWIVRMFAVLGFVWLGWSATGAVLGTVLSSLVLLVCSVVRVGALPRATAAHRRALRAGFLGVAAPTALAAIGPRLFERGDLLLLSALGASAGTLGHYGAAQNLTLIMGMLGSTLAPVLLSSISRHHRDGNPEAAHRIARDAVRIPMLLLPLAAIAVGAAPDIMHIVYGAGFVAGAVPLALLSLGGCALVAYSVSSALLVAGDRPWWTMAISVPMVLLLVLLGVLWYPTHGAAGIALASLVPSVLGAVAALAGALRISALATPWRDLFVCAGIAVATGAAAHGWGADTTGARLLKLLLLTLAAFGALVATGQVKLRGGIRLG